LTLADRKRFAESIERPPPDRPPPTQRSIEIPPAGAAADTPLDHLNEHAEKPPKP
jgi:hypothetical protein